MNRVKGKGFRVKGLRKGSLTLYPFPYTLSTRSGFTLIELLVVIVIIGILASFTITTYSSYQQRGRDTQRKFDLRNLQASLEQYYSQVTPPSTYPGGNYSAMTTTLIGQNLLKAKPVDPSTGADYWYVAKTCSSSICQDYDLCAKLENTSDILGQSGCPVGGTPAGWYYVLHAQ